MCQFLIRQPVQYFARLLVSDEATFTLNGHVFNHRTNVCYSRNRQGRPAHFFAEATQKPPKVMTFMVVCGDGYAFGPYFYEDNVTGATYRDKMENEVIPALQNHYGLRHFRRLTWQQDGAVVHRTRGNLEFLDRVFEDRMLALGSLRGQAWAPSSPDLSPLDFSVWAQMKTKVFSHPLPQNLDDLRQKIRESARGLDHSYIERVVLHMRVRAEKCVQANGGHFEGLRININMNP